MANLAVVNAIKLEIANNFLALGITSAETFDRLKKESSKNNQHIYDLAKQENLFYENELLEKIANKYGVKYAVEVLIIDSKSKNFPLKFCEKNGLVLLDETLNTMLVGLAVPSSLHALKNLALVTGKKVNAQFIPPSIIFSALGYKEVLDRGTNNSEVNQSNPKSESSSSASNQDEQQSKDKPKQKHYSKSAEEPAKKDAINNKAATIFDSTNIIKAVDEILSKAIDGGVSDLHFEIFKDFANVRFRKNGTLISIPEYKDFLSENYVAVIARIKILANLDIAEKRLPQDGKISFKSLSGKEVDFRVSVLPTNIGERIVIRILSTSNLAANIDALGFTSNQMQHFIKAIESPQGLILVTGPTGSGKSTTLYGAINYLNKPDVNILTAEDPIEYTLTGISQVQVRESIGLTFANALRSFLRQDPEIILVGEIRDSETADIATKAALTGHLVLSTLHTNSSIGAITRLINMGIASYLVSSALTLVVAQRLIRLNCKNCLEEEDFSAEAISPDIAKEIGLSKLMHSKGCEKCSGTGYAGRRAVYEVLPITHSVQKAIIQNASESEILNLAIEENFESMDKSAIKYLVSGELSLQEYLRVVPHSEEE